MYESSSSLSWIIACFDACAPLFIDVIHTNDVFGLQTHLSVIMLLGKICSLLYCATNTQCDCVCRVLMKSLRDNASDNETFSTQDSVGRIVCGRCSITDWITTAGCR